jgi:hypothetical protein
MKKNELIELLRAISFIDGRVRYINGLKEDKELYKQIGFICETILLHLDYYDEGGYDAKTNPRWARISKTEKP